MDRPLCFVLMPIGKKPDSAGAIVDFDAVYRDLIAPAIEAAGLEALRADEEMAGGVIHTPTSERLILCRYAVADLTSAGANVVYELGRRHAEHPSTTVFVFAAGRRLPFDVAPLRALPYQLTPEGTPKDVETVKAALVSRLLEAHQAAAGPAQTATGSSIYQLVENYHDIAHTKTDVFRDRARYSAEIKQRLTVARRQGVEAVGAVERDLGDIEDCESGAVIDLLLSYRAVQAWEAMIALVGRMSRPLAVTAMVQEQLAFALNRAGRGEEAERVLLDLLARRGPSSETLALLGRVYKDRWEAALKRGDTGPAGGLLDQAIDAYRRGFEADWRDAFPGINAVTLMELRDPPEPRRLKLIPVVAYAVERRIATGTPDYWDHATRLELAVLAKDEQGALAALADALAAVREPWEPETTARNLRLIREARERHHEAVSWAEPIEDELARRAKG